MYTLQNFACDGLNESFITWYDCTFVARYIVAEFHSHLLFISPLANLSHNKEGTFPSGSQLSLLFFISTTYLQSENLSYHGYYNKHTQRALHHTHIITVVNFLTLVLCFLGQHSSLVINKICQWLNFALKSFQKRLNCSRGFTVSATMTDLLKPFLQEQKVKTTKRKTLPFICLHSFLSPHEQDIALIIVFYACSNLLIWHCNMGVL